MLEDNKPSLSINGAKLIEYCANEDYPKINLETDKSNSVKWFDENKQALNEQPVETGIYYVQAFTVKGCASGPAEIKIIKK